MPPAFLSLPHRASFPAAPQRLHKPYKTPLEASNASKNAPKALWKLPEGVVIF